MKPGPPRAGRRWLCWLAVATGFLAVAATGGLLALRARQTSNPLGRLPDGLAPGDLNLLVVTLDTTRADRLGCYGSRDVATPSLDRLAARGALFENAVSPTPMTLPAHSTLFTGLLPGAHGVRDNGGFRLGPERVTLAEVLRDHGWATGGFVGAYVLDHRWGIAQGFERYFDDFDLSKYKSVSMGDIQRRGDEVVAVAESWLDTLGGRKFFAWVHLYDPHAPYAPPEPWASRYAGHPYNGEIAWTDSLVGRLLDDLDRRGLAGRTVVAVVGDHGESLGEHGESGHGFFLYEPTIHVPFLLAAPFPRLSGRRIAHVVSTADLAPTLVDLLGVRGGSELAPGQGVSLTALLAGHAETLPAEAWSEAYYPRFHYGWSELRSVRNERWHFIEAPHPELYDLAADPAERVNLAASRRPVVAAMRRVLGEIERATGTTRGAAAPLEEDEETLRKLAALGYVGSLSARDARSWKDLPDPKDRIEVYNLMNKAREQTMAGESEAAIATLDRILADDSKVVDAWFMLGNAYFHEKRWEQAAEAFRRTLAERPDHDYAMVGLADTLVATGRVDDAVVGYRRFLEQDPENAQITYRLAQVLLDAGRDQEAEHELRRTLAIEPKTVRAEVGLAVVAFRRHDLAGARQAIARALAIDPKATHARYNLALILEEEGDLAAAAAAYRAEIADHPGAYKAHFNLGRLLAKMGDRQGAAASLRRAVEANPELGVGHLFLAQALLDAGDLVGAASEARRGLALDAGSAYAPLGHYVLADVLQRQGRSAEAAAELARGRALEERSPSRRGTGKGSAASKGDLGESDDR